MKNVKICEIRQGSRSNYPHLISNDEKYLFCCSHQLGDYNTGDMIFCIHKPRNKAFFTVFTGEEVYTLPNLSTNEWGFEYEGQTYFARKNDVLQKLRVMDQMIIPPGWDWRRPLGRNQIYPLWNAEISRPKDRLARVNDLQLIFRKGDAYELLEYCNKELLLRTEIPECSEIEEEISLYGTPSVYEPETDYQEEEVACVETIPATIKFNDKYRQVLMAIKTKPFVLLAGISGVGKTRLVKSLAYKACFEKELQHSDKPGNFELIKVKPDWYDSSELIGYATQRAGSLKYNVTAFMRFIVKAWCYSHVPFFLCLDEMNLAKVEQYFAEYLSILETRQFNDGRIISEAFISSDDIQLYSEEDALFWRKIGLKDNEPLCLQFLSSGITLPPNLVVVGTVNMDETTHAFSRKVLDRAMTIEMNEFNMKEGLEVSDDNGEYTTNYINAEFLNNKFHDVNTAYHKHLDVSRKVIKELENINAVLLNSHFRFAYRVRNEILIYCAHNEELLPPDTPQDNWLNICLDEMIMMKILSRIEGNEKKCMHIIKELLQKIKYKFPASSKKLTQMLHQLSNSGYTSFWN
ncbi:hypothetical protein SAMN05518672_11035 [Chitinophaga sp. CF118]|uniref:McrB family protein n=1 Tax=Chitinophaga sp. CF118 TaxID=1884367 RepID=UPI0008E9FD3D|nr:hypothetical protein [Chitinophaga sp. CF118]SFE77206.1 hypothetical protein SAMN05518672_11035 [Chitinophaga sp. CF118]